MNLHHLMAIIQLKYWQYKIDKVAITWKGNTTVDINGEVMNLPNGRYDYRIDEN